MTFINARYQSFHCYMKLIVWDLAVGELSRNQSNHLFSMASDN